MVKSDDEKVITEVNTGKGFFNQARFAAKRYGYVGTLARIILYKDEIIKFIKDDSINCDTHFRKNLIKVFKKIHNNVVCAHSPYQFIIMAKYLFNLSIDGPIVQCGCFKGGSTAKLSVIAQKTNRKLYVFDSFQGLPEPQLEDEEDLKGFDSEPDRIFTAGEYKGELEEVKSNIEKYGVIDVCEFIPGFFNDSLPGFNIKPAFVYVDVDYVSSVRDCLKHIWPNLLPGGYWFTHEANALEYIHGMLNTSWWMENLNEAPPVLIGGGTGLSIIAPSVAFMQKSPE
ncbi:TylF/MycF/NovP-related O-methyltransferase [candidate division KSB1 bacterium]